MVPVKRLQYSVEITSVRRQDYTCYSALRTDAASAEVWSLVIIMYIMSNVRFFCVLENSVVTMYFGL